MAATVTVWAVPQSAVVKVGLAGVTEVYPAALLTMGTVTMDTGSEVRTAVYVLLVPSISDIRDWENLTPASRSMS